MAAALLVLASNATAAQVPTPAPADTVAAREPVVRGSTTQTGPLLERPVVRSEYRLGPGDVVDVAVFGEVELLSTVPVTPEGTVVVPGLGVARVLGLNLDEAQARVRNLVSRLYRNVEVTVSLAQVRTFKVFLVGAVPAPGLQTATSVTRVSEVISPAIGTVGGVTRRNVLLRRAGGDSVLVDLARFALLGDLSSNPTLREGDAVIVRAVVETVQVVGPVSTAGTFEYREGETLAEFLSLVNGGRGLPPVAADTVRVSRLLGREERQTISIPSAEAFGARGRSFVLQPFDAIYVASIANYGIQHIAVVTGQVMRPGSYPIRPGITTVRELVAMAGGLTPEASLLGATLRRVPAGLRAVQRRDSDANAPVQTLSREEQQIATIEASGDATVVVIDFEALFAGGAGAYDAPVVNGDVLDVPRRRTEVGVLGAVRRPGLVTYAPGRSVQEYIRQAGWFSRRADWRDAVVVRAGTGTRLAADEVQQVDPGDRIVVPYRERRSLLDRLQTTQSIVAVVSGFLLTVASIRAIF